MNSCETFAFTSKKIVPLNVTNVQLPKDIYTYFSSKNAFTEHFAPQ